MNVHAITQLTQLDLDLTAQRGAMRGHSGPCAVIIDSADSNKAASMQSGPRGSLSESMSETMVKERDEFPGAIH